LREQQHKTKFPHGSQIFNNPTHHANVHPVLENRHDLEMKMNPTMTTENRNVPCQTFLGAWGGSIEFSQFLTWKIFAVFETPQNLSNEIIFICHLTEEDIAKMARQLWNRRIAVASMRL